MTAEPPSQLAGSESTGGEPEFESWLKRAAGGAPDEARVPPPPIGSVVAGKYRIEALIGRGGMGCVYRAVHLLTEKQVALKWLLRPATDPAVLERFVREARAAARIEHPNVVDVYDLGQEGEAGYLVMELLRGESLRARLSRGALSPRDAVDLLLPAMRGVDAAHKAGVIHRDLKPDNLFLPIDAEGRTRGAVVLDFGISAIRAPGGTTEATQDGGAIGTPAYMSPEQLEGRNVDARTDVYSFGVVLYESLTGVTPFRASSRDALVLRIAAGAPEPLRNLRSDVPKELERAVLAALMRDRKERVPSMDALMERLQPFGSQASSSPAPGAARNRAVGRRGRQVALLAVLAVLAPLGLAAAMRWNGAPATTAAPAVTPREPPPVVARNPEPASISLPRSEPTPTEQLSSATRLSPEPARARSGLPRKVAIAAPATSVTAPSGLAPVSRAGALRREEL